MYRLGDILEFSYLNTTEDGGWIRLIGYALVTYVKPNGEYEIQDIECKFRKERKRFIADCTSGYRKVGNIWESRLYTAKATSVNLE